MQTNAGMPNPGLPTPNNFDSYFNTISERNPNLIENEEEKNWLCKAIEAIKKPETVISLQKRVSQQVDSLSSFTPHQIGRLVSFLDQWVKQEPDRQETARYLHQEVVALIIKKDIDSFENFFQQSGGKNYAIQSLIQLVLKKQLNPFEAIVKLEIYGIDSHSQEGQKARIEIAKLAAQQNNWITSERFQNFGIDASTPAGQQALIEIAKLAARQDGGKTSRYIQKYGIDKFPGGQQALIEIAKLAAQQNGARTSMYIKNYGLDKFPGGQQALIEIAKLAAQRHGGGTSEYIKDYGIDASKPEGQQALIEIAKLAAEQDGEGTSEFIQNYGIDDSTREGQQALIEIAKLAVQKSGTGVSRNIKNYSIDPSTLNGQRALIEIFKLAAQQNVSITTQYFESYHIDMTSDEGKERFKDLTNFLFSCYVKQFGPFSYSTIGIYLVKYRYSFNGNGEETYQLDSSLFVSSLIMLKAHVIDGAVKDSLQICASKFDMKAEDFQGVKDIFANTDNKAMKTDFLEWWMTLATLCASREDLKRLFREKPSVFESLCTLPSDLRNTLTKEVIASTYEADSGYLDKLKAEIFDESSLLKKITVLPRDLRIEVTSLFIRDHQSPYAESWESMKKATEDIVHARLACLILAQYPKGDYSSVLSAIKSDRSLREAKYQKPMLEALLAIKNSSLGEAAKVALVQKVFNIAVNERQQGFRLVTDILNFKGEAYLSEVSDFASLKAAVEKLFVDKCKVQLDNFRDLYENTVGTWRSKEALLTYAGKHTDNPAVLPYFQEFLTAVLQGHFMTLRYAVDNNSHLAEIQQHYPKIFEQWKLSASLTGPELGIKESIQAIPVEKRVIDTLKQAVENDHLGLKQQKILFPHLTDCKGKWEQVEKPLVLIAEKLAPLSNRRLTPEEIELRQRLLLEKNLLELIKDPSGLEKKLNNLKGIKIKGLDEALSPFYQDLKDAVKFMYSAGQPNVEAYTVIDTDDPNHFLLMGTEVLNSCQDVKGSASLNVGLLGYALDGKHRLALVCDSEGKILARSVLRLLIDAEGKPVLFQERMYVADANPAYSQLLRKIALKKADLLGVPLVVSPEDFKEERAKPYPLSIQAKAKPVPYEYVDALDGLQSGPYIIDKALHVNSK